MSGQFRKQMRRSPEKRYGDSIQIAVFSFVRQELDMFIFLLFIWNQGQKEE